MAESVLVKTKNGIAEVELPSGTLLKQYKELREQPAAVSLIGKFGNLFVLTLRELKGIRIFRRGKEAEFKLCNTYEPFTAATFTADGSIAFFGGKSGTIYVHYTPTGRLLRCWCPSYKQINYLHLSFNDEVLYSCSEDGGIHAYTLVDILDVSRGDNAGREAPRAASNWSSHSLGVTCLQAFYTPSFGDIVVSGSLDKTMAVRQLRKDEPLVQHKLPSAVLSIALSVLTLNVYVCCEDSNIYAIDISCEAFSPAAVTSLPVERASKSQNVMWASFIGHSGPVVSGALNKDSSLLSTCATDGLRIWDVNTQLCVTHVTKFDELFGLIPLPVADECTQEEPPVFPQLDLHLTPPDSIHTTHITANDNSEALQTVLRSSVCGTVEDPIVRLQNIVAEVGPHMEKEFLQCRIDSLLAEREVLQEELRGLPLSCFNELLTTRTRVEGKAKTRIESESAEGIHPLEDPLLPLPLSSKVQSAKTNPFRSLRCKTSERILFLGSGKPFSYVERKPPSNQKRQKREGWGPKESTPSADALLASPQPKPRISNSPGVKGNQVSRSQVPSREHVSRDHNRDHVSRDQSTRDQPSRDQPSRDQLSREQPSREQPSRHQSTREQASRDRDQSSRDHVGRDQSSRDHSNRDHSNRDHSNRDHVGRDHSNRDHVGRDHSNRDYGSRDQPNREQVNKDSNTPRQSRSSRAHEKSYDEEALDRDDALACVPKEIRNRFRTSSLAEMLISQNYR